MIKYHLFAVTYFLVSIQVFSQNLKSEKSNSPNPSNVLVWSDEFDVDGPIDATKWFHQTQLPPGGSWYNKEVQHYTDRLENSYVKGGVLNIVAKKETFKDQGHTKEYTSARLNSKYAFQYGRVEVRAKLPIGVGTWPAIWMLAKNIKEDGGFWTDTHGTTAWPACGEIDIMEHWGSNQNYVQSAMHTTSSHGNTVNRGGQTIATVSSAFHTYELDWNSERMIFSVDGVPHYTYNPKVKDAKTWPYDSPQYFLLNIAIEPIIPEEFTQSAMEIDFIRVYEATPVNIK
ncbi:glycoside hydrolase family 16 protein [Flavobacteriaceae bacterium]|nr:glycoside hydrolase family 16 protein [Flavobacteriaceae bacterium]